MNAHHRNICRYPNEKSQNYILVEAAIRALAGKILGPSTIKQIVHNPELGAADEIRHLMGVQKRVTEDQELGTD
jgi:hypothetical protein